MRIMALWNTQEDDAMKVIRSKSELKNARFNGRKPDKLIVPGIDLKQIKTSELKKHISYTGLILVLGRDKPVYDGRVKAK